VVALIAEYVNRRGWSLDEFLVSSFDHTQLQEVSQFCPEIRTGALVEKPPRKLAQFAEALGVWSLHIGKRCLTPKLVADAHRCGLKVFVFTINQPREIARMKRLGVDGVFSDFPERVAR
jgi:glycerophosphoryl diester phosphodiesterase